MSLSTQKQRLNDIRSLKHPKQAESFSVIDAELNTIRV
jgi:hypothetical protein